MDNYKIKFSSRADNDLNNIYSEADKNILKSTLNVNLNTLLGYKKNNKKHNFLEDYNDKK